jgi:hypothetical protein
MSLLDCDDFSFIALFGVKLWKHKWYAYVILFVFLALVYGLVPPQRVYIKKFEWKNQNMLYNDHMYLTP